MLFGFIFLKKRYSLLQIVCLLRRTLTSPLTINQLDLCRLCHRRCHYGYTIKTYAKSGVSTISFAGTIGRLAGIHDRYCNDRRLLVLNGTFGLNARKNVQEIWTMLERRCILHGTNIHARMSKPGIDSLILSIFYHFPSSCFSSPTSNKVSLAYLIAVLHHPRLLHS